MMSHEDDFDVLRELRNQLLKEFDDKFDQIEETALRNNPTLVMVQLGSLSATRRKLRMVNAALNSTQTRKKGDPLPLVDPEALIWHKYQLENDIKHQQLRISGIAVTGSDEELLEAREKLSALRKTYENVLGRLDAVGF